MIAPRVKLAAVIVVGKPRVGGHRYLRLDTILASPHTSVLSYGRASRWVNPNDWCCLPAAMIFVGLGRSGGPD
jgi:hypothetical protein